eukprot:TRINITY_DN25650_c0_g1_i1.p1 TRINITY_DN25650_c0_g1~~TRINITY_DN25650_c0_g1_i1.p1  ORF type:complete len:386 (+),score=97.73 TRINITY_DN25650_c0_g1_i1:128-1285(+)
MSQMSNSTQRGGPSPSGSGVPVGSAHTQTSELAASTTDRQETAQPTRKGKSIGSYHLVGVLGEGSYAKVYKGVSMKTGVEYAVKCIQKEELLKNPSGKELLYREIGVMKCLRGHPNIVELKEILQTDNNIYLVMEIVRGGELFFKIKEEGKLAEDMARNLFQQLMSAVIYCHSRLVAHRDIKPENIILSEDGVLKVTDFGLSNLQKINEAGTVSYSLRLRTICGTPHYIAPEVISDERMGYNGFKADIWSCGVVLYHMLVGHLPFRGSRPKSILRRLQTQDPEDAPSLTPGAKVLIWRLLTKNPDERPQSQDVLEDPWFSVGFDASRILRPSGSQSQLSASQSSQHQGGAGQASSPTPTTPATPQHLSNSVLSGSGAPAGIPVVE